MGGFPYAFECRFYPVGQGLFSAGVVFSRLGARVRAFTWVYDCGSSSGASLVDAGLRRVGGDVGKEPSKSPPLDLLTISHFDGDHVSGVVRLLGLLRVHTILLPYLSLPQRILLALAEIGPDDPGGDDLLSFLLNPPGHLARVVPGRFRRILFVPPSDGEEGVPPGGREVHGGDPDWTIDASTEEPHDPDVREDLEAFRSAVRGEAEVAFLKPRSALTLRPFWELVPYNDARRMGHVTPAFVAAVGPHRDALRDARSPQERKRALDAIRRTYDGTFGAGSRPRNDISLFLYAGPLRRDGVWRCEASRWDGTRTPSPVHPPLRPEKASLLYTGDGYLDTADRLAALQRHLGPRRWDALGCLQVMHHGSCRNWHPGLAGKLAPSVSVFSSDPAGRFRHPHPDVLQDFRPHGPVQVDKMQGATFQGEGAA